MISRAVVEVFAPKFLRNPAVLFLSDSGDKVVARDEQLAAQIGLQIHVDRNLPDIVLVDVASGQEKLVFIEVVATDGPITPQRQAALAAIATEANFPVESVFFVSAFADRSKPAFRKLAAELAWNSFAWFVSEPNNLLCYKADASQEFERLANPPNM